MVGRFRRSSLFDHCQLLQPHNPSRRERTIQKTMTIQRFLASLLWLLVQEQHRMVQATPMDEENENNKSELLGMNNHHPRRRLDQVFADNLSVQGNICAGNRCTASESFNTDTLRFKQDNIRIHFQDTSNTGNFPFNDWRIVINDSFGGGSNYFGVEDSSAGRIPFLVEAGAIENALVVGSGDKGFVGFGTDAPQANLHVKSGECPALRLEKDSSAGFLPKTWEIRNVGAKMEFRCDDKTIMSLDCGAPENSLVLDSSGSLNFSTRRRAEEEGEHSTSHTNTEKMPRPTHSGVAKAAEFTNMGSTRGSAKATVVLPQEVEDDYMVFLTAETKNAHKHYTPNVLSRTSKGFEISLGDSAADLVQVNWIIHHL